ncbi:hypothetical protein, variant [Saprolegnia diclina VS20]|uniref:Uncharacterized protein n=1 Tax=Saprolegnia diclina (strain VS20) TaxID=1156394 RepID=T0QAF9_SAPDV|nr:hypothetical protein, variant [Saprolegnia diclina VS20]EQC30470.1 hypothetical protein, variant [Saprolegnia diclina VS20]|eukprot:XP_008616063.1 hypothetical protein, variant [Saprolegnia diclina VS20]
MEAAAGTAPEAGTVAGGIADLKNGVSTTYTDDDLHFAASAGQLQVVARLLAQGAAIDATSYNEWTPLHYAVYDGQLDVVRFLLEKGATVDALDQYGRTPCFFAAAGGHVEITRLLLAKGAAIDVYDNFGKSPLLIAEKKGHVSVVQLLRDSLSKPMQEAINPSARDNHAMAVLQRALEAHDLPLLRSTLNNLEIASQDGTTRALMQHSDAVKTVFLQAAATNDTSVVERLLSLGASPTLANEHGETALHLAAGSGHVAIVTSLLKVAKDETYVNAINHIGHTPLHVAAAKGHASVVESLLGANANVFAMTTSGETPLMLATNDRVRAILNRVEAKANAQRGAELVDAVCKRDYRQTVVLLASGVSPNAMNEATRSCISLCNATTTRLWTLFCVRQISRWTSATRRV